MTHRAGGPRQRHDAGPSHEGDAATPGASSRVPAPFNCASRGKRLQRVLAESGIASRRACEAMIETGRVHVNGVSVAALPAWVNPLEDRIQIDGRPVAIVKRAEPKRTYVVLNKPRRVISTTRDPQGRTDVVDLVNLPQRLYPVGRLDADSSGLILLTNDGELANRLTHPRYEVPKLYHVTVRGRLTEQDLEHLKEGLYLAHRSASARKPQAKKATVARVKLLGYTANRAGESRSRLALTLREGQNRQIRRLLARLGHKVQRLERVAIGPIRVKGLAVGQWRLLTGTERRQLRRAAGLEA